MHDHKCADILIQRFLKLLVKSDTKEVTGTHFPALWLISTTRMTGLEVGFANNEHFQKQCICIDIKQTKEAPFRRWRVTPSQYTLRDSNRPDYGYTHSAYNGQ